MSTTNFKILIINSRKDQLARSASELNKHGFSLLISDGRTNGYKIAREKMPDLVLHFINNVSELPAPLNVSDIAAIPSTLVIVDSQSFLSEEESQSFGCIVWQGLDYVEALPDKVKPLIGNLPKAVIQPAQPSENKILVVDDELMNQTYYQEVIAAMGLDCDACGDIATAEELIATNDYKVVVTDVFLGNQIGLTLNTTIKNCQKDARMIVVTGLSALEFNEQFGEFDCAALMHKPVNPQSLRAEILNIIEGTKSQAVTETFIDESGRSRYNPERAFRLLKNNEANIREVMEHFATYLSDALQIIVTIQETSQLKLIRKSFHDLGNLCYYFGAEILFEMIGKFSTTQNEHTKLAMLKPLIEELKKVNELHQQKKTNYVWLP